jgi:hypothetical protein
VAPPYPGPDRRRYRDHRGCRAGGRNARARRQPGAEGGGGRDHGRRLSQRHGQQPRDHGRRLSRRHRQQPRDRRAGDGNSYDIRGTHTYTREGSYPVSVTVTDSVDSQTLATATGRAFAS